MNPLKVGKSAMNVARKYIRPSVWNIMRKEDQMTAAVQIENQFIDGVSSMARNCLASVQLVRSGKWDLDDVEIWLKAVVSNDSEYLKGVVAELNQKLKQRNK